MAEQTVGFVGGGRVARIVLGGLVRAGRLPAHVVVSDVNPVVLHTLQSRFPALHTAPRDNRQPAVQDIVFLALHPPALSAVLGEIRGAIRPDAVVVSLAPKTSIAAITEALGGFDRIVRCIPNAPSLVGRGYNPIAFSAACGASEREQIGSLLRPLGTSPEVPEAKLEAYAVITGMGPTYLWFQLHELRSLAESFGLGLAEAEAGLAETLAGSVRTLFESGMTAEEVMDLVPVKPLEEEEAAIKAAYRARLEPLYRKLTAHASPAARPVETVHR